MGDHDYGTHDTNLCAECLGYAIGKRVALREAADDLLGHHEYNGELDDHAIEFLLARADAEGG